MMKLVAWVSLAVTILGAIGDLTQTGGSGGEDAAEIALMAKMLAGSDGGPAGSPGPSP